ncbi:hypothetical protein AB0I90_31585 [Micromonospora wenchangensis]|uniref:hypothetical protein n=1 Tax=Micromonospora wenchangensis TaxID=1185415 RepID=UPI0033DFCDD2
MNTPEPVPTPSRRRRFSTITQRLSLVFDAAALIGGDDATHLVARGIAVCLRVIACMLDLAAERDRRGGPDT